MAPVTTPPTVCVIGLGYIGLPTAAVLAQAGHRVIGVDVNPDTVAAVSSGTVPFVEDGLGSVVAGVVARGLLTAQTATPHADFYIMSVPTPFAGDHRADLTYIRAAAKALAPKLTGGEVIVLESTAPPGTTEQMAQIVLEARPDLTDEPGQPNTVHFAHAPERVLPGRIMIEMVANDRIIGGLTPVASEMTRELYASFCQGDLLITDARTAEMAKLTENAFRDVNIAFANELSLIADSLDIDVWELIELANHHPRVNILQPGPGVGGHCVAVDPWFIVSAAPEQARLIRTAREVNDSKPAAVVAKVLTAAAEHARPTVAVLGIAFKPNIDDLRESPAKQIALSVAAALPEGEVLIVEPHIDTLPKEFENAANCTLADADRAIAQADVIALLVDHDAFRSIDPASLAGTSVVDTKGMW